MRNAHNRLSTSAVLAVLAVSALTPACADDTESSAEIFAPAEEMYGKSVSEWDVAWWQWVMNIPAASNPLAAGDCTQDQNGDVWFLAGNQGGAETRTCTIPEGKAIFFPLLNGFCHVCPEVYGAEDECPLADEAGVLGCVAGFDELEKELMLSIDGHSFSGLDEHYAAASAWKFEYDGDGPSRWFFDIGEAGGGLPTEPSECLDAWEPNNECGVPAGPRLFASNGYYVMVKPLPAGDHTLQFGGRLGPADSPFLDIDVTYEIEVEAAG